jgi:hypothetical protein
VIADVPFQTSKCGRFHTAMELQALFVAAKRLDEQEANLWATEIPRQVMMFAVWVDIDNQVRATYESIRDDPTTREDVELTALCGEIDRLVLELAARPRVTPSERREALEVLLSGYRLNGDN